MPRKTKFDDDEEQIDKEENKEQIEEPPVQLVTENQLLNAKLDHIIKILEKEFKGE